MGIFSKFEGRVEDTFEGAANKMFDSPISPVQIAKKAEKKMRREKMVGAGKQYAPTLYTVLVNETDDQRLFGYYPTLAGETETYLLAKAAEEGLVMDGQPLVRFIVDEGLRKGKFDIVAELVASPIVAQLREEEMERYGIGSGMSRNVRPGIQPIQRPQSAPQGRNPLPYVPEDEIDYSIDYGEYTFDSQDFDDYSENGPAVSGHPAKGAEAYSPADQQGMQAQEAARQALIARSAQEGAYPEQASYAGQNAPVRQPQQPHRSPEEESALDSLYRRASEPLQEAAGGIGSAAAGVAGGMGSAAAGAVGADAMVGNPHIPAPTPTPPAQPNTVVFAAGSGNAQPIPNNALVRACLMNTADNRTIDLATVRLLLGRGTNNDIVVDDINASRSHAELRYEPQGVWVVTDLGSTNGTLVNGREITSQALRDGDYLTIGMTNYVFIQA